MPELDSAGRRLLAYFVEYLKNVEPGNPATYVSYKAVHTALDLPLHGPTYGASLQNQGLNSLAAWTVDSGLPAITGIVIDAGTLEPAQGYFKLLGNPKNPYERWKEEVTKSKFLDWAPYLTDIESVVVPLEANQAASLSARVVPSVVPLRKLPVPGAASVWRLIAYHDDAEASERADEMARRGVIAIGWSEIGDLTGAPLRTSEDIGARIREAYPHLGNSHTGGPTLWHLLHDVAVGDLVIIVARSTRKYVMEVTGDYFYADDGVGHYRHQRNATLTDLDPDELWHASGAAAAEGESMRWTLTRLSTGGKAAAQAYEEGERFEVRSTAVERNPHARKACIEHHGAKCYACGFDFFVRYGALGEGYIHVHHRKDIALTDGVYTVDPIKDLVPLCPNCHAMVHREKPAADVEAFKASYWS